MTQDQAKFALEGQHTAFQETVKQPNTLERNIVLAEHRAEITRLQKFIAKSTKV